MGRLRVPRSGRLGWCCSAAPRPGRSAGSQSMRRESDVARHPRPREEAAQRRPPAPAPPPQPAAAQEAVRLCLPRSAPSLAAGLVANRDLGGRRQAGQSGRRPGAGSARPWKPQRVPSSRGRQADREQCTREGRRFGGRAGGLDGRPVSSSVSHLHSVQREPVPSSPNLAAALKAALLRPDPAAAADAFAAQQCNM